MFKTEKHQTSKTTNTSDSSLELDSDICKPIKISSSSLQSKAKQRSGQHSTSSTVKTRQGSSEFGDMTVQELENYAVSKSEETTSTVNNCLKIAENIRQDATNTLVALHQQGEQITRTHMVAVKIEQDLTIGEKLLGSLGGLFSKTWKPKKTHGITGPLITKDDSFIRRSSNFNSERESLGLVSKPKGGSKLSQPTTTLDKVEIEKEKQDEALSDLSNIIGQLKGIAVDMNTELDKQNKALDHLHNDVEELDFRMKGANQRTRRLLGK